MLGEKRYKIPVTWLAALPPDTTRLNKLVLSDREGHVILALALSLINWVTWSKPPLGPPSPHWGTDASKKCTQQLGSLFSEQT